MKRILTCCIFTLLIFSPLLHCTHTATPYFRIRSQSVDSARDLVGLTHLINLFDQYTWYGTFAITPEYTQSFRETQITRCLFGTNCLVDRFKNTCHTKCFDDHCECPTIQISGSRVENRCSRDWLADYFGLAPDFVGFVSFEPRVQNFLVDFNLYLGLDEWVTGLYFRIHAPVVHTRWKLDYCETICNSGTFSYDEGYFAPDSVARENLLGCFSDYISNCGTPNLPNNVVFQPLLCCKWANCCDEPLTDTKLSDIQLALGWNFWQTEDFHFGINIRGSAPTGTSPTGEFLFEPVIGNGGHWELGAGFTFHHTLWYNDDETQTFGVYADGNFTHLFTTCQCRCFDLCNGCNSRYMLAQKVGVPVDNLFATPELSASQTDDAVQPMVQFKNIFTPVANLTHIPVDVTIGVQADITLLFNYSYNNLDWDVGYNFWATSCEEICLKFECCPTPLQSERSWTLKGDSHVYGYAIATVGGPATDTPIALSTSESLATIHSGTNNFVGPNPNDGGINDLRPTRNPGVDNSQFARTVETITNNTAGNINDRRTPNGLQTETSRNPIFITNQLIDTCNARVRGVSHKVFTNISYTWKKNDRWIPYLGIGAKAEIVPGNDECCNVSCKFIDGCMPCPSPTVSTSCTNIACTNQSKCCGCCKRCALSEWGVWIKGGFQFR